MELTFIYSFNLLRTLRKLGAVGLFALGIIDGSVIPLPGSVDALTILLTSRHHDQWLYYAAMAAAGSTIGALSTYRLANKRGRQMIVNKLGEKRAGQVMSLFARWGFAAVAVPAIMPPPFPLTPFLLTAGAMHYPLWRFTAAIATGRVVRFGLLAYFVSLYGRRALRRAAAHYQPLWLWALVPVAIMAVTLAIFSIYSGRTDPQPKTNSPRINANEHE